MNRPGLLVVNSSRSWGGNEDWAVRVAAGLAGRGHPVRFAWCHDVVGERVRSAGLAGARVELGGDADPRGILRLREQMVRVQARAVLLTRPREYLHGGLAARLAWRPRVVLRLGLNVSPPGDVKRRLMFGLADRVVINAPEIGDSLRALPWFDAGKLALVINGTDLDAWHPGWTEAGRHLGAAFRAEYGIGPDAPLAVNVGNLTGQKDQATLVEAAAAVRDRVPGLRVLILGEGAERENLQALVDRLGLADTVTLGGFAHDVPAALAAADLFVLSSVNEGMARVLIEAAAAGLPVVTTDVSGARYAVADGETGLVVPPSDAAALGSAMADLLGDPDRRRRFGRSARARAERLFTDKRMLDETTAVLFGGLS